MSPQCHFACIWLVVGSIVTKASSAVADERSCAGSAPLAGNKRQEKERCLLQYARLSQTRAAFDDGAAATGTARPKSYQAPARDNLPINVISPYSKPAEVNKLLGAMSISQPEHLEPWEADYIHDDQWGLDGDFGAKTASAQEDKAYAVASPREHGSTQRGKRKANKWSQLAELRIPVRLRDIHNGADGPLPKFVRRLRKKLQAAMGISLERIVILGVRGEYMKLDAEQIELLERPGNRLAAMLQGTVQHPESGGSHAEGGDSFDCKAGADLWETGWSEDKKAFCCKEDGVSCPKETSVHLEVLPRGDPAEATARRALAALAAQLADPGSSLRRGALASYLKDAQLLQRGKPVSPKAPEPEPDSEPEAERSASSKIWHWLPAACGLLSLIQIVAAA